MSGTRLVLARHGQAHCNVRGVIGGPRGCTGLTSRGRTEAGRLAARLHHLHQHSPVAALYTSPIRRVVETAAPTATALGLRAQVIHDLREPDYGTCDGQPWSEVVARFGKIPARHPDLPIGPGAETWNHHYQRVRALLIRLLDHHDGQTIAVIAHGETITAAAHLFLNLPTSARADVAFAAHNAALTIWEQQPLSWTRHDAGTRWALTSHNDTAHLTSPPLNRARNTRQHNNRRQNENLSAKLERCQTSLIPHTLRM